MLGDWAVMLQEEGAVGHAGLHPRLGPSLLSGESWVAHHPQFPAHTRPGLQQRGELPVVPAQALPLVPSGHLHQGQWPDFPKAHPSCPHLVIPPPSQGKPAWLCLSPSTPTHHTFLPTEPGGTPPAGPRAGAPRTVVCFHRVFSPPPLLETLAHGAWPGGSCLMLPPALPPGLAWVHPQPVSLSFLLTTRWLLSSDCMWPAVQSIGDTAMS